jgi:hypothetical protein
LRGLRDRARDASKGTVKAMRCLAGIVACAAVGGLAAPARAAVDWQPPERVSSSDEISAWFPTLAVDSRGRAHVVWSDTAHRGKRVRKTWRGQHEQLAYAVRDEAGWSMPRPIAIAQQDIYRQSLAVDAHDRLHLLFRYSPGSGLDLYYRQAPAEQGFSEGNWQRPRLVNFRWNTYVGEIAVRGDVLHMVFDDVGTLDPRCAACADIYYQRSTDGGDTWSPPLSLRPSLTGSAWPHLFADAGGVLHVTWDEGWDRNRGVGRRESGVYMLSADGGDTWSSPTVVNWPDADTAQLTAGSNGAGGVMLVWRSAAPKQRSIYFQSSDDWGATWSEPAAIPDIQARSWTNPFDRYHMTADGAGRIHLLANGLTSGQKHPALYHLEWDGTRWSAPVPVYAGERFAEYPQLAIDRAGRVHATWYARAAEFGEEVPHQVWYAQGRLVDAPPPAARPVPHIARAFGPAPTPVPLQRQQSQPTPPRWIADRGRALILSASIPLGVLITLVSDWIVRRRRIAA